ncbi:hypothetical protein SmphiM12_103 [Sinorhizobium phage phiM12]|uniref:Uncharacterized protein n=1 Tax=Sinorhizobium phage phiM12 TaxID=1357423 RepID=S5MPI0_9CAUD|nr:hypothetical protein AB690_gp084 [Sinorhizobium phage phiM12]AGR47735.1 hypothetical protein SmphiM12_103 [Sinorhizobium phage phiM12]
MVRHAGNVRLKDEVGLLCRIEVVQTDVTRALEDVVGDDHAGNRARAIGIIKDRKCDTANVVSNHREVADVACQDDFEETRAILNRVVIDRDVQSRRDTEGTVAVPNGVVGETDVLRQRRTTVTNTIVVQSTISRVQAIPIIVGDRDIVELLTIKVGIEQDHGTRGTSDRCATVINAGSLNEDRTARSCRRTKALNVDRAFAKEVPDRTANDRHPLQERRVIVAVIHQQNRLVGTSFNVIVRDQNVAI